MARYFFHLHRHGSVIRDDDGQELVDLVEAQTAAARDARSMMADEVCAGNLTLSPRIEIHDADDRLLLNVSFRSTLTITD